MCNPGSLDRARMGEPLKTINPFYILSYKFKPPINISQNKQSPRLPNANINKA